MRARRHAGAPARRRGMSLAKGPVALIGVASLVFGILGYIFGDQNWALDAPSGTVNGGTFIGVEGNGWTWALFAAGGLLLLLASPAHWGAKSTAFIVGLAYGVAALIALSDGSDVFGVFAENGWTELVFGATGVALLLLAFMPRVGRDRGTVTTDAPTRREAPNREPVADRGGDRRTPAGTTRGPRSAA